MFTSFNVQKFISLENGDIFCTYELQPQLESSTDDLIPLFILHPGAGYTGLSFSVLVKHLEKMYSGKLRVLSFDPRGHGATKVKDETDFSLQSMASDLLRIYRHVMSDLQYGVILVGHRY
jgi:protein phosphatase methylesterase 1